MKNRVLYILAWCFVITYFVLTVLLVFTRHTSLHNLPVFPVVEKVQDYMSASIMLVMMWIGFTRKSMGGE